MYAGVAQLVEHYLAKVDVASSNLVSRSIHFKQNYSALAQSVERRTVNPQVPGSTPGGGANYWGCSSPGRAVALQAIGSGFESCHLHQLPG